MDMDWVNKRELGKGSDFLSEGQWMDEENGIGQLANKPLKGMKTQKILEQIGSMCPINGIRGQCQNGNSVNGNGNDQAIR